MRGRFKIVISLMATLLGLAVCGAAQAIPWYFQEPASQLARDIDLLHQYVMWLIIVIFVGVFGFMFYACWAHRKSVGHKAEQFHENSTVELIWTIIPAIILVIIAWPVTKTVIAQKDSSAPNLTIKVTGIVLNGRPGTAMAPFKHLSDVDTAGVITYTRNDWNNKSGETATPDDVKAQRK